MVRLRGRQLAPAGKPRPHAHGLETRLAPRLDVPRGVSDDEDLPGSHRAPVDRGITRGSVTEPFGEGMPPPIAVGERPASEDVGAAAIEQFTSPPYGRLQQRGSMKRVRSEAPEGEVPVEPGGLQLDARPFLDVAGAQAEEHALLPAQAPQKFRHPGTEAVAALAHRPAHLGGEVAQVLAVHAVDLPAARDAARGRAHRLREITQVGLARQVQFPAGPALAVEPEHRAVERLAPGPAGAHQGPVHVEEQHLHPSRGSIFHGVPWTSLPFFHTALTRFAPNQ